MFNFHKRKNLFQTRVIVEKKEELPPELKEPEPLPNNKRSQRAEQTPIFARRETPDEAKSAGSAREETEEV